MVYINKIGRDWKWDDVMMTLEFENLFVLRLPTRSSDEKIIDQRWISHFTWKFLWSQWRSINAEFGRGWALHSMSCRWPISKCEKWWAVDADDWRWCTQQSSKSRHSIMRVDKWMWRLKFMLDVELYWNTSRIA